MLDGTPVLKLFTRARVARMLALEPAPTQERLLLDLVSTARDTRFGRAHGFDAIRSVADFQSRVQLRRYEQFWSEWWQADFPTLRGVTWPGLVPYFALSSGTTSGTTKYIPVTAAQMAANRGAALDTLAWHLHAHPRSRPFAGLSFMLGGSTALQDLAPGVRGGDLSGIAAHEVPRLLRGRAWPPESLALMPDWDAKLAALAERTPRDRVRVLTGTPSWLLVLLHRMAQGGLPFPNLELLIHGGVAWAPYRDRLAPFLPRGCATREVYPASEGFVAIQDRGEGEGMRLVLDRGCFFEFVPVAELDAPNPTRHWAATIETGIDYAVVVSSNAGLFAYVLGDVVRFLDRAPPRLLVTGRTAWMLSAFGEHVTGEEITRALDRAAAETRATLGEWCCGPEFVGELGRHRLVVESADTAAVRLGPAFDAALLGLNEDYAAHRQGGQMLPPVVDVVPPGRFNDWMRAQGKAGGQHKVPRVIADPARFAQATAGLTGGPPHTAG
ncbi:GH3 family domain-containing protein [Falsiroseomonas oryziterrae]|uniref:GH3 family domain-containing protein n=1 Tax=Falsiroseomonas oryziterrae TaxID=2911368 RepID=UPI001F3D5208|nr:GH3 auxin-responsive promoter family protein [Roseomonas sp. NPKOSM-4]